MAKVFHVHVDSESKDCDGPHGNYYIISAMRGVDKLTARRHWKRIKALFLDKVDYYGEPASTWNRGPDAYGSSVTTDEGYSSTEVYRCYDPYCDLSASSQRDVYAERMGY